MRLFLLAGLIIAALTVPASAQGVRFGYDGCDRPFCVESDWIYDDNTSDHTTEWRHGLRVVPRNVSVLFTPDPNTGPVMPLIWPWTWQTTGNPQGIELNRRTISIHIWSGAPIHGIWRPGKGWTTYSKGYWKFIAYQ